MLIQPILFKYLTYAFSLGLNQGDLKNLMNETYFKLYKENKTYYENFSSYYRKKYEFDLLNLFKKMRNKDNLRLREALSLSSTSDTNFLEERLAASINYLNETGESKDRETRLLLDYLESKRAYKSIELEALRMYLNGFTIPEIASLSGLTEYKIRTYIKNSIKKIAKDIKAKDIDENSRRA